MARKRVAVVLSGCGVRDGAEIHEATLTLLALDQRGAVAVATAPDKPQRKVVNHFTGQEAEKETRNCLVEAARIARGEIVPLSRLTPLDVDAAIVPGGYGAALNLCDLGVAGPAFKVDEQVLAFLGGVWRAGKPLGALCIAPPILAAVLAAEGVKGARLTIGNDKGVASIIASTGQKHVECPASSCVVDRDHRIVTCPAYMLAGGIAELWQGIEATVAALLDMA